MASSQQKKSASRAGKFIFWVLVGIAIVLLVLLMLRLPLQNNSPSNSSDPSLSLGDKILLKNIGTDDKNLGAAAFAAGNYQEAMQRFEASLSKNRNDPEALIYFNNAAAKFKSKDTVEIAVSVPIGKNPNVAAELLRGVAQAQDEINTKNIITDRPLTVTIANDDNEIPQAKSIAQKLVARSSVLGVVGHNASNASLAAAPIYQASQLVMITPTSFSNELSGAGSYIFRSIPPARRFANHLANHVAARAKLSNIAVCYHSQVADSKSFRNDFINYVSSAGNTVLPTSCDMSEQDFNAEVAMQNIIDGRATALVIIPSIDQLSKSIAIAQANRGRLPLFGSSTLYTYQTLKEGQSAIQDMIFPAIWHPQNNRDSIFPKTAKRYWGGEVSWRTATSYDATMALGQALVKAKNRIQVQQTLRQSNFSAVGAGDAVQFDPQTGDRVLPIQLLQVQATQPSRSGTGFDFVPLENTPN
jgi:branched-chain amino acid transport system substrate-binding protein